MFAARTTAAVLALALAAPVVARAQSAQVYAQLVADYADGHASAAMTALAAWPERSVDDAAHRWAKQLPRDRLPAAVMLHTDLALWLFLQQQLPSRGDFHLRQAAAIVEAIAGSGRPARSTAAGDDATARFAATWYEFAIGYYLARTDLSRAASVAQVALSRFPDDPQLLVSRGWISEMSAVLGINYAGGGFIGGTSRSENGFSRTRQLEGAARAYRRALDHQPDYDTALLHLGYIHLLQRDNRAKENIEAALAHASTDEVRYLAHLFLGGLAEGQQRFEDAAVQYAAARDVGGYQTACIAASRIESALGHDDRARELALEAATIDHGEDPWWRYQLGAIGVDVLETLRQQAGVRASP